MPNAYLRGSNVLLPVLLKRKAKAECIWLLWKAATLLVQSFRAAKQVRGGCKWELFKESSKVL